MKKKIVFGALMVLCCWAYRAEAQDPVGRLRITLAPAEAPALGAQWRRVGTATWFNSGQTEQNVPVGTVTVEFKPLSSGSWYHPIPRSVTIQANQLREFEVTYSPYPILPNFGGCANLGAVTGAAPYAPLPRFNIMVLGSLVDFSLARLNYDFCAYADTVYCSLQYLASFAPEILEFGNLVQCRFADINGPLASSGEIPITPNGIPDMQYELGILAKVLNTPSHPLYTLANTLFEANFQTLKDLIVEALYVATLKKADTEPDKDLRSLMQTFAPFLTGSLTGVLTAFATTADPDTNRALDELLGLLEDIGLQPPEGGIEAITDGIPELGAFGDADGDRFSNYAEYQYFVGQLNYTPAQYVAASLDPNQKPPTLEPELKLFSRSGFYCVGRNITLTIQLINYFEQPEYIRWYKDSVLIPDANNLILEILNAQESDSGIYTVKVGLLVEHDGKELTPLELQSSISITVVSEGLSATGIAGLGVTVLALGVTGLLRARRKQ